MATSIPQMRKAIAVLLMVVGLVGAFVTSGQLTNGWVEIPMHWWSTLATAPLFVGVLLMVWPQRSTS